MIVQFKKQDRIISEVSQVFQSFRDSRIGQQRYPLGAKKLAVSAIKRGCSTVAVTKAAGISRSVLAKWQRKDKNGKLGPRAIQLKLVESETHGRTAAKEKLIQAGEKKSIARIYFRSGATLEIATEVLTASLVSALNGDIQ